MLRKHNIKSIIRHNDGILQQFFNKIVTYFEFEQLFCIFAGNYQH